MSQLNLFCFFHLNIFYSSIPEDKRKKVIEKCYWPILKLAENSDVPVGVEISGASLEVVKSLDPAWVSKFKELLRKKKCELIGSGYMQIIGPLVPAEINEHNQKFGMETYKKILGVKPDIALVNEQAYSSGLVAHYLKAGYKAIIMEWNNPYKYHPEWKREWQYYPQYAVDNHGGKIPIIWNNAIAFQKFQRYVYKEIDIDNYLNYLKEHISKEKRAFALYGNDAEIFDFRPGRFFTEAPLGKNDEWERIGRLFQKLKQDENFNLMFSSETLGLIKHPLAGKKLVLESAEQPIPVKKQEKYNATRWAITGAEDVKINTDCHRIYEYLKKSKAENKNLWKKLCYLWGSDFRTHIEGKRFREFKKELCRLSEQIRGANKAEILKDKNPKTAKNAFKVTERNNLLEIESGQIKISLNRSRGLAVHKLIFKEISPEPLIGTLYHGYYDDIFFAADFYTGHTIIEYQGLPKSTDLMKAEPAFEDNGDYFSVKTVIKMAEGYIKKEIKIYRKSNRVDINLGFNLEIKNPASVRTGIMTFMPFAFDEKTLFFRTVNGGFKSEKFLIKKDVDHAKAINSLISSSHCLGATEGWVEIGDRKKSVRIYSDKGQMYSVPMVKFQKVDDTYFLRVFHSIAETDETVKFPLKLNNAISFSISGSKIR